MEVPSKYRNLLIFALIVHFVLIIVGILMHNRPGGLIILINLGMLVMNGYFLSLALKSKSTEKLR